MKPHIVHNDLPTFLRVAKLLHALVYYTVTPLSQHSLVHIKGFFITNESTQGLENCIADSSELRLLRDNGCIAVADIKV